MKLNTKTIRNLTEPKYHVASKYLEVIDICHLYNIDYDSARAIKYIIDSGKEDGEIKLSNLNGALRHIKLKIELLKIKKV